MKIIKLFGTILFSLTLLLNVNAQETAIFTEAREALKRGNDFYQKGLYGQAQQEYRSAADLLTPVNDEQYSMLQAKAKLGYAKCAVRLEQPDGQRLITDFTREYAPDPAAQQALLEIGNYYYNQRDYDEAIRLFSQIDAYGLSREQRTEVLFKLGYCYFVKKQFVKAKSYFQQTIDIENQYFYPSNYYYGLTEFFENNYDSAIQSFQKVSRSKRYDDHIPFYITQIYFAKGEYENVLKYGIPKAKDNKVRKRAEIHQLIGQAYFEQEKYRDAVPYFEYFLERTSSVRQEDYYQIGYTYYKNKQYRKAIENFEQLSKVDNELGQNAMYTLGDCHLKEGDKNSARNAFGVASRMAYDEEMQQEAQFHYAKLSYELGFDRDALLSLQQIPPESKHYPETQVLLSNLFLRSRDYENAISLLDQMPEKTQKLRETYQKVAYLRALQVYREGDQDLAQVYFNKSLQEPIDGATRALSIYWLGEIAHNNRRYDRSISEMNKFLSLSKGLEGLPDEASIYSASYIQGYNFMKQKNYPTALEYFMDAINGIRRNARYMDNPNLENKILPDAVLRAGDCHFKGNNYQEALVYYNEAVDNRYPNFVYALYQKAVIEGLRGNTTEKILALEEIGDRYPQSPYADDALLLLGTTYQEMGRLSQAIAPLQQLVSNFKGKSNLINKALLKLGLISYNQGNISGALRYYQDIFKYNPEPQEASSALAAIEEIYVDDLGEPDRYIEFLETIPGYNVDDAEKEKLSFESAEAQYENGNYERSIQAYTRYLQRYPNGRYSLIAHYNRAESNALLKNYTEALVDYDMVVNKGVSNFYNKALRKAAIISRLHEKDFQRAFIYYTQMEAAAITDDEKFEAQIGALESAYEVGNGDAVYQLAGKVINNTLATNDQKATAHYYKGKLAYDQRDYDQAIREFTLVPTLTESEMSAESKYLIAEIYYKKRDLERAKELSLNSYKESAGYPVWVAKSVILLADIFAEQGDLFNAEAVLEGLIENFDDDPEIVATAKAKLERLREQSTRNSRLDTSEDDGLLDMDESINEGGE
jgi:tetratricopeptide (TPR) repeat protein